MEWHDVSNKVRIADAAEFKSLRCPECGGLLNVEYVSTAKHDAFYIQCADCEQLVRSHGEKLVPPWTVTLGSVAKTG